jgi:hypothetical protein
MSKERKNGQKSGRVELTYPRKESTDLKNLRKRDIVQELG